MHSAAAPARVTCHSNETHDFNFAACGSLSHPGGSTNSFCQPQYAATRCHFCRCRECTWCAGAQLSNASSKHVKVNVGEPHTTHKKGATLKEVSQKPTETPSVWKEAVSLKEFHAGEVNGVDKLRADEETVPIHDHLSRVSYGGVTAQPLRAQPCEDWCAGHAVLWNWKCVAFKSCMGCLQCFGPWPPMTPPSPPRPPPSPSPPPPLPLWDLLNTRFTVGTPSASVEGNGVLIHVFDDTEDPKHGYLPSTHGWSAGMGFVSASMVNAGQVRHLL